MDIITANWNHIRVKCDKCGNIIEVTSKIVKCACGREEHIAALQEKKLAEHNKSRKLDRYLDGYDAHQRRSESGRRVRA